MLGTWLLQRLFPETPVYVGLIIGVLVLVAVLVWIARRFVWIMPWYYLLPSLLFLITFTVMPVGLTIFLAFTDYAGNRNTQLNPTTETAILQAQGSTVQLESADSLRCDALYRGCDGVRVRLNAAGAFSTRGVSLEGDTLTVDPAPPAGRAVAAAELELSEFDIRAQFPVIAVDGDQLTLGRTPPGEVNLDTVALELAGVGLERRVASLEGDTLTLSAPLPEGLTYTSVARYNDFSWVGLNNFRAILGQAGRSLLPIFVWNLSFATLTVVINIIVGVFLAVLLNDPELRLRNLYRTLLIIPWALPAVITIQIWRGLFNYNFGAINRLFALFDLPIINWLGDPTAAKAAVLLVNLWLSFPFMMTATLSALSAIPDELYEAARIDGASAWQSFWSVTSPLLRNALVPIALTSFAVGFNNFNVIFLLTDGGPAYPGGTSTARATDILISWAYNEAFRSQGGFAYGLGSAISIIIFVITLAVSLVNFRVTGALKEESNV